VPLCPGGLCVGCGVAGTVDAVGEACATVGTGVATVDAGVAVEACFAGVDVAAAGVAVFERGIGVAVAPAVWVRAAMPAEGVSPAGVVVFVAGLVPAVLVPGGGVRAWSSRASSIMSSRRGAKRDRRWSAPREAPRPVAAGAMLLYNSQRPRDTRSREGEALS